MSVLLQSQTLSRTVALLPRAAKLLPSLFLRRSLFTGWFQAWQTQRMVYPPSPQEFTTKNRIFESYITHASELQDYVLFKQPTLLNFTYAEPKSNKVTQALFDILSDLSKYPNKPSTEINLINIMADTEGGRELMMSYAVGSKIPAILLLKKQLVMDKYVPNVESFQEQDLIEWIKTIE